MRIYVDKFSVIMFIIDACIKNRIQFELIRIEFLSIQINSNSTRIVFWKKLFNSNSVKYLELIRVGALLYSRGWKFLYV